MCDIASLFGPHCKSTTARAWKNKSRGKWDLSSFIAETREIFIPDHCLGSPVFKKRIVVKIYFS